MLFYLYRLAIFQRCSRKRSYICFSQNQVDIFRTGQIRKGKTETFNKDGRLVECDAFLIKDGHLSDWDAFLINKDGVV